MKISKTASSLTNFKKHKYCQNEPKFDGIFSKYISSKKKNGPYIINLDEYESIVTYWTAFYVTAENVL